jgi:ABC-type branched-subunit amino acid transport system substrate-binding protein
MKIPSPRGRSLQSCDLAWIALSGLILAVGCDRKAQEVHFVGHVAALTGPQRDRGTSAARGVQLAVEEVNADQSRWVGGRKVAVIHADTKSELDLVGRQGMRLATVNRVPALLGGLTQAETDALAKVTREYGVVLVGSAGTVGDPPAVEAFAVGVAPVRKARIIDQFLHETLKPTKVALLVDENLGSTDGFVDTLTRLLTERKIPYLQSTFRQPDEFVGIAQKWGATLPVVVFVGSAEHAVKLLSITEPPAPLIFAGDEVDAQQLVPTVKDDNGPYWVGAYARESVNAEFVNKYVEKFQMFPPVEAMMGYDTARVLFTAAQDVRSFAGAKLVVRLRQNKPFDGLMGTGAIVFGPEQIAVGPAFVLQATRTGAVMRLRVEPEVKGK